MTPPAGGPVRVVVDHGLCSGTGHCASTYRELFVVRGRKSWLRPGAVGTIDRAAADAAASECPWFAIAVTDDPAPSGPLAAD